MPKPQQPQKKERDIESTLSALSIDTGISAEEAAQDAAQALMEEQDPTSVQGTKIQIPPPEGEDGDGEEDDDRSAGADAPLPEDGPPHMPQGLVPAPQRGRQKFKTREAATTKLSKSLLEKMPGVGKVKVYKRDNGQRWFVRDFTAGDLQQFSDFESFIARYVQPAHGYGEYDLVAVDGNNRETECGQVRLREPIKANAESGAFALVERVLNEQKDRDKEWLARMEGNKQLNPLELLAGVMNLKKEIDGDAGNMKQDVLKAAGESSNNMMSMMMMMMNQQQQAADRQNQLMMTLLTKPREEDPMLKLLMAKLLKDEDNHGGGGGMPMAAIPAPVPQPNILEIINAVTGIMQSAGGGGGDDDFKDFLKTLLLKQQNEGLGIKDILQLVTQQQEKRSGTDDFRSAIDNMAAIMNVAQNINKNEGSGSAGIWDALASLFSNRDFAGGIANAIRAKTDKGAVVTEVRLKAEQDRLHMQARMLEQQRRQIAETQRSTVQPPAPAGIRAVVEPMAQPQQAAPAQPVRQTATPEEVQQAADRVVARTGKIPELPANTSDHLNGLLEAKDDGDLVGKTVSMMIYFAEFDDWRPFVETILENVRGGNKKKSLEYVKALFDGFAQIELIPAELSEKVVAAISEHFVTLQKSLEDIALAADSQVTADALLEGADADVAAAE